MRRNCHRHPTATLSPHGLPCLFYGWLLHHLVVCVAALTSAAVSLLSASLPVVWVAASLSALLSSISIVVYCQHHCPSLTSRHRCLSHCPLSASWRCRLRLRCRRYLCQGGVVCVFVCIVIWAACNGGDICTTTPQRWEYRSLEDFRVTYVVLWYLFLPYLPMYSIQNQSCLLEQNVLVRLHRKCYFKREIAIFRSD
jgi:hypothetical protein